MKIIIKWLIASGALLAAPYLIPGISVSNFYVALVATLILGVLSVTVKPLLVLLTLPINMLTLGLFTLVINAAIFWFLATVVKGLDIDGFVAALLGSLFVSAVLFIANKVLDRD